MDYFKIIETSLKITAYQTQKKVEENILKGIGWPKAHPMRTFIFKHGGSRSRWIHSPARNVPFKGLIKGLRYSYKNLSAVVDFSFTQKFVDQMEKTRTLFVTPKMRRMFGAGRPKGEGVPGVNFLPLKTQTLKYPARKIKVKESTITKNFEDILKAKLEGKWV